MSQPPAGRVVFSAASLISVRSFFFFFCFFFLQDTTSGPVCYEARESRKLLPRLFISRFWWDPFKDSQRNELLIVAFGVFYPPGSAAPKLSFAGVQRLYDERGLSRILTVSSRRS